MFRKSSWRLYVPKLFVCLHEGYSFDSFRKDLVAGLTVAIVALPLAMALAIASGTTPDRGLITAVVAGFLISLLGGSRHQIGGPTGAFVVVVFGIIAEHGYEGLVIATAMAGIILIAFGLLRFGTVIKYVPYPVVTGFTAGIAVIIFSSQVKDFLGLDVERLPAGFLPQWQTLVAHLASVDGATVAVGASTLALIISLRRWAPRLPGFLIAVVWGTTLVAAFELPVATIGSRFGGIPATLPVLAWPDITADKIRSLIAPALTIAILAGIESLLSAMVADGMTGRRHRSNCELVAQGVANLASAAVGGLPATGAIARTATNIKAGARTPVAGMVHALLLAAFMVAAAPLADGIPLASLSAILLIVAWGMSEIDRFRHLFRAPVHDQTVLLTTFALTILVDLTVAIEVGVVLAALLFMKRMSDVTRIETGQAAVFQEDVDDFSSPNRGAGPEPADLPPGVQVVRMNGPFFFAATGVLEETLERIGQPPKIIVLRMRDVPAIDATGAHALSGFVDRCRQRGTAVIVSGARPGPLRVILRLGLVEKIGRRNFVPRMEVALERARALLDEHDASAAGA